jgi:hypothetical protein
MFKKTKTLTLLIQLLTHYRTDAVQAEKVGNDN